MRPEIGRGPPYGAEFAIGQQPGDDVALRQEPRPHRLHGEDAGRLGGSRDLLCFGGVHRDGLLDEHVLSRRYRQQSQALVLGVESRDVDDVDGVILQ